MPIMATDAPEAATTRTVGNGSVCSGAFVGSGEGVVEDLGVGEGEGVRNEGKGGGGDADHSGNSMITLEMFRAAISG